MRISILIEWLNAADSAARQLYNSERDVPFKYAKNTKQNSKGSKNFRGP